MEEDRYAPRYGRPHVRQDAKGEKEMTNITKQNASERIAALYRELMRDAAPDDGVYRLDVLVANSRTFGELNGEEREAVLRKLRAAVRKDVKGRE
jgi:hypothetical protein